MSNEEIIWTVVIVLAVLVLIGLIVAAMRKKGNETKRVQAQQMREEAHGGAAGLPDAQARAEQAATQAEHKRLEAERAEKEALRVRTELDQERARHEDQLRAADRLDPDVNHKAKDYSPEVADPAGPSNIPSDPIHADPATGRAPSASTTSQPASDPDTILDRDHRDSEGTSPRHGAVGGDDDDDVTLRDRLDGDSSHRSAEDTQNNDGGSHRA